MSVHKKLMQARIKLQSIELKKSGQNKFAGFSYFELGDFLPAVQSIFAEVGLCGVVSYSNEYATLKIFDVDQPSDPIVILSPMAELVLKGTHPIQNMGAIQTYQRRYLWMTALEIVEHDQLDATVGEPVKAEPKPEPKPVVKPPKKIEGKPGSWQLSIGLNEDGDADSWVDAVLDITKTVLGFATTAADVREIFKVNKAIYENLKQVSDESYNQVLGMFRDSKDKFKEE
jgi:hypothetical protein